MRLEKLENFARACGEIFGVSVIFGVFCSCLFNMMIFEDWNLNYFQIAGMNDILVSAIEFGFYTFFLIGPIFLIYTYSSISNLFFNDIAFLVSRLKLIPVNIQDFVCGYVFALIHSIFLVTFIYTLMGFIGIFDSSSISLSKFGRLSPSHT